MSHSGNSRFSRPETITAIVIVLVALAFVVPTLSIRPLSALLPATMLTALVLLAGCLLAQDQRAAAAAEPAMVMSKYPRRVVWAFSLIVLYALAVDFVGFYPSTALSVPLVSFVFGYRNLKGLCFAAVVVLSVIYLIFGLAMSHEFPTGRLWSQ